MNILVIDSNTRNIPYSGKTLRLTNIIKGLCNRHKLHYIYIKEPEEKYMIYQPLINSLLSYKVVTRNDNGSNVGRILNLVNFKPWHYAKWRFRDSYFKIRKEITNLINSNDIEIIHCFDPTVVQYVKGMKIPSIADFGDSNTLHLKRKIRNLTNLKHKLRTIFIKQREYNYEKEVVNRSSASIFVSHVDAELYSELSKRARIYVIPNGVDSEYFNGNGKVREEFPSVIFSGHMNFAPNIDAVLYFYKEIFPHIKEAFPDLKFSVVGAEPSAEILKLGEDKNITVTGKVDDMRPFFNKASVFVCPMRIGAGIKNKLLEAMAMSKPIVSTTLGAEAIDARPNKDVIIADSSEQFAQSVINLLKNKELRSVLARNGRQLVEKKYSWDKAVEKYNQLYEEVIQDNGTKI